MTNLKEHIFVYNPRRVALKSGLIWFGIAFQIGFSIFILVKFGFSETTAVGLFFVNVGFSCLNLPGYIVHLNHLKWSRNAKLILRYNSISYIANNTETTLNTFDVQNVILHHGPINSRLTWWNYSWFELIDKEGKSIKVSFYLLEIHELWLDSLSRRISSDNMEKEENFLPLIK